MRAITLTAGLVLGLSGCGPSIPEDALDASALMPPLGGVPGSGGERGAPQYAPDDPCKGVVPELCAYR